MLTSLSLFISLNDFFDINASPLTSSIFGGFLILNFKGIDLILLTLLVIFSPSFPSPRVAAFFSKPFSYFKAIAFPSIFNSAIKKLLIISV